MIAYSPIFLIKELEHWELYDWPHLSFIIASVEAQLFINLSDKKFAKEMI